MPLPSQVVGYPNSRLGLVLFVTASADNPQQTAGDGRVVEISAGPSGEAGEVGTVQAGEGGTVQIKLVADARAEGMDRADGGKAIAGEQAAGRLAAVGRGDGARRS